MYNKLTMGSMKHVDKLTMSSMKHVDK